MVSWLRVATDDPALAPDLEPPCPFFPCLELVEPPATVPPMPPVPGATVVPPGTVACISCLAAVAPTAVPAEFEFDAAVWFELVEGTIVGVWLTVGAVWEVATFEVGVTAGTWIIDSEDPRAITAAEASESILGGGRRATNGLQGCVGPADIRFISSNWFNKSSFFSTLTRNRCRRTGGNSTQS